MFFPVSDPVPLIDKPDEVFGKERVLYEDRSDKAYAEKVFLPYTILGIRDLSDGLFDLEHISVKVFYYVALVDETDKLLTKAFSLLNRITRTSLLDLFPDVKSEKPEAFSLFAIERCYGTAEHPPCVACEKNGRS